MTHDPGYQESGPRPLRLTQIHAKCNLCDWTVSQIDASEEHAEEVVDRACEEHARTEHPDV